MQDTERKCEVINHRNLSSERPNVREMGNLGIDG